MVLLDMIKNNFPNACEGQKLTVDVVDLLPRELGMTPKNTLVGFCTCPDEINREVTNFSSYYGPKQFPLGGLAGYPFTGKTGFGAFSHHAPNNGKEGNIIIIYGPHLGINEKGELGKVLRDNQSHESSSCGAAIAFLNKYRHAKAQNIQYDVKEDPLDPQQCALEKKLLPSAKKITEAEDPMKELVEVNYQLIDKAVSEIVSDLANNFKGKIVLIGGVMINTSPTTPDYFDLRRIEMHYEGKVKTLKLKP